MIERRGKVVPLKKTNMPLKPAGAKPTKTTAATTDRVPTESK